ncbi:hypothetical protein [Salmonella enterica]|uniref:Membrane protein n=2 Tax=Salmonella enterica TaxID=28901 RepID=A0A379QQQ3_SALER|nr:hypothetical protein [Salmonella enterica]ECC1479490.1 hypothetical protein [Salmonella enterica subsp. salamae]ASG89713.1 hypothetical protein LFZ47_20290 [Salmonella enterica subsp. salamae serovar 55:k:z39 str. 1315K]ECC1657273.1 hypothetical protein [Salmonella enterica subsp. salamae]ECD9415611.1 hypothetical protein [Salmonella enterica subsp. salamae]ECF5932446.1 hypothetical protein [Salmonella enterica subsp. salamae]
MTFRRKYLLMAFSILSSLFVQTVQADAEDCQITFSSPNVSFGAFKQDDIVDTQKGWHQMPSRDVNVSVYCPESQKMGLFVQARAGEKGRFYFGDSSGLAVRVSDMVVDGKSYPLAKTLDRSSLNPDGDGQESLLLHNNEGIIAVDNHAPVSGKQLNFTLKLTPVLNDQQFTRTADVTSLESDLMWELVTQ